MKIAVCNILDQKARTLVDRPQEADMKRIERDGKNDRGDEVASGIHFHEIRAAEFAQSKEILILK